jgi:hypothetical protein
MNNSERTPQYERTPICQCPLFEWVIQERIQCYGRANSGNDSLMKLLHAIYCTYTVGSHDIVKDLTIKNHSMI